MAGHIRPIHALGPGLTWKSSMWLYDIVQNHNNVMWDYQYYVEYFSYAV